jgi:hypothetical protein
MAGSTTFLWCTGRSAAAWSSVRLRIAMRATAVKTFAIP